VKHCNAAGLCMTTAVVYIINSVIHTDDWQNQQIIIIERWIETFSH